MNLWLYSSFTSSLMEEMGIFVKSFQKTEIQDFEDDYFIGIQ